MKRRLTLGDVVAFVIGVSLLLYVLGFTDPYLGSLLGVFR